MTFALWAASAFCGLAIALQLASIAVAIVRCRLPARELASPDGAPPITIIRPVCGLDNFVDATLRSTFVLDYPRYEILFCAASARDPVVALVRGLIAEYPRIPARLLIGDERISANPKLNNVFKGWRAAANDRIVMADSNVLLPHDYVQRLLATWRPDTGMVSAPPIGSHPHGFWAQLECAFLNTYQARWQYTADTLGLGFAQGKTLFYRRSDIERAGGLRMLAAEAAEDAASTKIVRASGAPRAAGRRAVPTAAGRARPRRRVGPPGALGAAAARQLSLVLLPRSRLGSVVALDGRRFHCNCHRSFRYRCGDRFPRALVRRGNAAGGDLRLAPDPALSAARDGA